MQLSITPVLVAVELGFLWLLARRGGRMSGVVFAYWVWLVVVGAVATVLGARGVYLSEAILASYPGAWLLLVPIAAFVVPVVAHAGLRSGLRRIADATPWHWLAYFHALRILALGTAYKTWIGEFPVSFELFVGLPDLLFGISALWIAGRARRGELGVRTFLWWNVAGVLAVVPAAPIVLQLGLPGPLQVFGGVPDTRALLTYPMSNAPMFGVPLFVLLNFGVAWRLWERRSTTAGP